MLCAAVFATHIWYLQPLYNAHSAWKEAATWLVDRGQKRVFSLSSDFNWMINGIEPLRTGEAVVGESRYIALYRRYPEAENEHILSLFVPGTLPEYTAYHLRPIKMMELQLVQRSPLIEALAYLPVVGPQVEEMRDLVAARNRLRRIEIYDLTKLDYPHRLDRLGKAKEESNG